MKYDERMIRVETELKCGASYVTPGGLKYWPVVDDFRSVLAELEQLREALHEAYPYVRGATDSDQPWRRETAEGVLDRICAALAEGRTS